MWIAVAAWVVTLVVAVAALSPKPQNAKAATLEELDVPVAEEGLPIPVLFGTRILSGPNVVWYGALKVQPVKSSGGK